MWKNGTVIEKVCSYQTYSVATSACQVVQACIWNSIAQLAKAWHSEQAVLEAGAAYERRGTVNTQLEVAKGVAQ